VTKPPPPKLLISVPDTAIYLSIGPRSVWRLIASGDLKVVRCNRSTRVTMASIEALTKKGGNR